MPTEQPDVSRAIEQVAELRREFDAFVEHEKRNVLEQAIRFAKIERQVSELAEAVKQIQSRLDKLGGKNDLAE